MDDTKRDLEGDRIRLGGDPAMREDRRPARGNTDAADGNRPVIIAALYLASFITGITGFVGVVLAHMWSGEARGTWVESHYTYLIRTFWFGLLGSIVGALLMMVLVGFLILPLVAVWFGVRSVLSLMRASKGEPMPDPKTLLF